MIDDPNVVFEIQGNAAFPVADLFGNFDVVDQSTTGDVYSGTSNMEIAVSTGATTNTLPLKALDNTNVYVVIQNHIRGQGSAGLA